MAELWGAEERNAIVEELRNIRLQAERTNGLLARHGIQVKVFWKIAWGIIMAQVLTFMLFIGILMAFGVFGVLAGAAGAAGSQSQQQQQQQAPNPWGRP